MPIPPFQLVEKVPFSAKSAPTPNPLPRRGRGLMAALARRSRLGGFAPEPPKSAQIINLDFFYRLRRREHTPP